MIRDECNNYGPQPQILPLVNLDRVNEIVGGGLLNRLAATDRIHGNPRLELGAVSEAHDYRWEPLSGADPASEVNDGGLS